jgi:hypothetical protein
MQQAVTSRSVPWHGEDEAAATFRAAVAEFEAGRERQRRLRSEFTFEDTPAPRRLAPHAAAMGATVWRDGSEAAWGRLVLLYDPREQQSWAGGYRLVAYLRAEVEPELASDPMLCQVGWSWLTEALDARTPGYTAPSGTVSRVTTEGFGGKGDEPPAHGFELRASWSPIPSPSVPSPSVPSPSVPSPSPSAPAALDLAAHVMAWCDSLGAAAGLPPLAPGVCVLDDGPAAPGADQGQRPRRRP